MKEVKKNAQGVVFSLGLIISISLKDEEIKDGAGGGSKTSSL